MTIIMKFVSTSFSRVILCLSLMGALSLLSIQSYAADWRYSVRPGDTFWSICKEYTVHENCWLELANLNSVANPNQLSTGTQLLIPMQWLKQAPFAAQAAYVVS
jgi:nucleoid-associated protein YgaU